MSVISTNDFAYLPGLLAARPSAFAEGEGFEPPKRFAACLVSSEVLSTAQPTLHVGVAPSPYIDLFLCVKTSLLSRQ